MLRLILLAVVVVGATIAPAQATNLSGVETLKQAGKLLAADYSIYGRLPAPEKLKRERAVVARNAPALALVRRVIAAPNPVSPLPPPLDPSDLGPCFGIGFNARNREFARQFAVESDVRAADGDFVSALNSRLDAMELGALVGRGTLLGGLAGVAIESIGTKDAEQFAAHLNAAQCRQAVTRLERIEARRATLTQVLRDEERAGTASETQWLAAIKVENGQPAKDGDFPTAQDLAQLKALPAARIESDNARLFDALVQDAERPYSPIAPALPADLNPMARLTRDVFKDGAYRFSFARTAVRNRLLRAALTLRALKLDSGAYPDTFTAPVDPFSPTAAPLLYRKQGDGYLLYSVGPDGNDDGGAGLVLITTDASPTNTMIVDPSHAHATGDIVQAPF